MSNIPQHVAIIMDGNRRWATEQNLPAIKGHEVALDRIEELVAAASEMGISYLTLWAWSNKNWSRNPLFVKDMMELFRKALDKGGIFHRALENNIELRLIGSLSRFPKDITDKIQSYLKDRPSLPRLVVNLALGYDGREELVQALKRIVKDAVLPDTITPSLINEYLYTAGQPDVDFLIRTGGEQRTSGFLIWQIAEAEYYFTDTYFPSFDKDAFKAALEEYAQRERRFGGDTSASS